MDVLNVEKKETGHEVHTQELFASISYSLSNVLERTT